MADYGSGGWGFESLAARTKTAAQRPWSRVPGLAIGALPRAGMANVAAALRYHARDPARPLATLGITLGSSHP